jgi:hypothetical protein
MFGEACWHNPFPHTAWIIDDPLLRSRYGLLRYAELIRAMDAEGFATTAFGRRLDLTGSGAFEEKDLKSLGSLIDALCRKLGA